jgi:phage I-like protein
MRSLTGMYDLVRIAKLRPKFLNPKKQANMPETLEKRLAALNLRSKFMIDKQLAHL